ncbi:hypothetical protein SDC9_156549 [bioreactor metagenome]|uniref:Uncharacterized protein n=1 Tax=bioreactor metagenome TaxID=1076179 RepID=A0A645F5V4_9ZZZZ
MPDIIKEVLGPYGFSIEDKLTGSYRTWDYMVQYGETDFNFISRLLEAEGGYFYFEHSQGNHKLVLADDIGSHSPLPNGPSTLAYYSGDRAAHVHDEDFITAGASPKTLPAATSPPTTTTSKNPKPSSTPNSSSPQATPKTAANCMTGRVATPTWATARTTPACASSSKRRNEK